MLSFLSQTLVARGTSLFASNSALPALTGPLYVTSAADLDGNGLAFCIV